MLATSSLLGTHAAHAATWRSTAATTDWNTFSNWSGSSGGSGLVIVNSIPANIATITADINPIPTDITVGYSAAGRVNHLAGLATVSSGNDLTLGTSVGGNGTYNLANTAATGGVLTNFGQGSGSVTIPDQVHVGGLLGVATGLLNIHTTGSFSVGTQLRIGNVGGTGAVKMDSGTLTVADDFVVGNGAGSTGTFSMSDGTVTKTGASTAVTIGGGVTVDGGTGTANLNGGSFTTSGVFRVGHNFNAPAAPHSTGTLNLGGTDLLVNGEFWVGNNTGAIGTMNFTSGSLTVNNWSIIGRKDDANTGIGATGSVTMTGGTWTKSGESNFIVGDTGNGTMNMSGGLIEVVPHATADRGITWIGNRNNCTGILSISGTAEFRSPRFVAAVQAGTSGTLNLNGGTVETSGIAGGLGNSTVNFNGSQIIATGSSSSFIEGLTTVNLLSGGLKVDSNGFDLIVQQALSGTGGVTKSGAGNLKLSGSNSFAGSNSVEGGKLTITTESFGTGEFTVANGAALGVVQTFDTSLSVSNVTLGISGAATFDVGIVNGFGNPTSPPLDVTGTLAVNGPITVNITDPQPDPGSIPLIAYGSKSGSGSFVLGSVPLGVTATIHDDGVGLVTLEVSAVSFPVWQGTVDGKWDTSTQNWRNQTTLAPLIYQDFMPVMFDDTAPEGNTTNIVLDTISVTPGSVTFNNETKPYTLGGTGKISGSIGLTKSGAATVSISTLNDFTGVTTINGGIISVSSLADGGSPSPLGAGSSGPSNLLLNGGTLEYTGAGTSSDRGFTTIGIGGGITNGSDLTLSGEVVSGTGGNFIKSGAGKLELTNTSITLGAAGQVNEVKGGTLAFTGPGQTVSVPGGIRTGTVAGVSGHLTVRDSTVVVGTSSVFAASENSTSNVVLGGSSVYTATDTFQLATNGTAVCNFTIQDNAQLIRAANGWSSIGNDGTAVMTVKDNGSFTAPNDFNVSDVGTSNGTLNVQDSATVSATGIFFVGKNSGTTGTVNVTGGTLNSASYITVGRRTGATGIFNISGGTVNQTGEGAGFIVGENGTGTLNMNGGTLDINGGGLYLSAEAVGTSHSVAHLNGGTIIAKRVVQRDFNSSNYTEFHFNGGILRAHTGANTDFMFQHDLVTVDAGGAFIDSNGQSITISQALGGAGSLTKLGAGTLTLSGANTYGGNTTVNAGTLSLSSGFLSNTGTVTIASGAVLNLNFPATTSDSVASLVINGVPLGLGIYNSTTHPGVITGTGRIEVTGAVASPYASWISGYPSIPLANRDPGDDPDGDGVSNVAEFALNANPSSGASTGKIVGKVASVGGNPTLVLTLPVRTGATFSGATEKVSALIDGLIYHIQGSDELTTWNLAVGEVLGGDKTAIESGLPALDTGWTYRTFQSPGVVSGDPKDFLRAVIEAP